MGYCLRQTRPDDCRCRRRRGPVLEQYVAADRVIRPPLFVSLWTPQLICGPTHTRLGLEASLDGIRVMIDLSVHDAPVVIDSTPQPGNGAMEPGLHTATIRDCLTKACG